MRELTAQEMDLASGSGVVVGILGVVVAMGSLATTTKGVATAIGVAGLILAGISLVQSNDNGACAAQ